MPCLTKNDFQRPLGLRTRRFNVEGEDYVVLRSLSSRDLLELQERHGDGKDFVAYAVDVLSRCLVDDGGGLLFDGPDDVKQHLNLSPETLRAMCEEVASLSGLAGDSPPN